MDRAFFTFFSSSRDHYYTGIMSHSDVFDTSDPSFDASAATRAVAQKNSIGDVKKAIRLALEIDQEAISTNTRAFNRNRYPATAEIEDYDALKDRARAIKEQSIEQLPELIETVKETITERGGNVHVAEDGEEARRIIRSICEEHEASRAVKAKSMTSEEIHLNEELEKAGMEVMETDLAEFILQVANEPPSHLVGPAIHRTRERISKLFKREFDTDEPLDTGEELTIFARKRLREKFIQAEIGITGANILTAEDGAMMLVESEGNIRMVTELPPVHIALSGVEKIIPSQEELGPFLELLAPSGTGQRLTSYTSVLKPPLDMPVFSPDGVDRGDEQEFHLVLMDNGRFDMRDDPQLREALYCIRCSACLNSCANFQVVGGHAFGGETYSGGIGSAWEAGTNDLSNAEFNELCTGCSRCVNQCPVRIDIPWLNTVIRDRLNPSDRGGMISSVYEGILSDDEDGKAEAALTKQLFGHFNTLAGWGQMMAPLSNWITNVTPLRAVMEELFGISASRTLPNFASRTLQERVRLHPSPDTRRERQAVQGWQRAIEGEKLVLVADSFTTYFNVDWGKSVYDLYRLLGFDIELSDLLISGRSALSQGLVERATQQARAAADQLEAYIRDGYTILVNEPSVLAMIRRENERLLQEERYRLLNEHSFGTMEYLVKQFETDEKTPREVLNRNEKTPDGSLFFHVHCQQRTLDLGDDIRSLFEQLGHEVTVSSAECCGMAGSFGYKKDFDDVSRAVFKHLNEQIEEWRSQDGTGKVLAAGISCREQIEQETDVEVRHPSELLLERIDGQP